MLSRSQQVAEHRATRTCFLASSPLCPPLIFTDLSKKNFICYRAWSKAHAGTINPPPPHGFSLPHTHTHTYIEGEHQQLVFSLCFSRRAALILPDKGWESQENISTHKHACRNVPRHYHSRTAHSYTSVLVAFYHNRLCHRFQCSLVQLG